MACTIESHYDIGKVADLSAFCTSKWNYDKPWV